MGEWNCHYANLNPPSPLPIPVSPLRHQAAADLRKRYPEAAWLNGNQLHMARHELTHAWEPVTQATKKEVLRRSILDHITPECVDVSPGGPLLSSSLQPLGRSEDDRPKLVTALSSAS